MPIVTNDPAVAPEARRCAEQYSVRSVSGAGAIAINNNDYYVKCDATAGAQTPQLPSAAANPGRVLVIKKKDASANAVTVTRTGTDTINNAAATTFALATQDKYVALCSDGVSSWDVIANN